MGGVRKALMLVGREFHGLHASAPYAFQPFIECEHPICKEASNALAATEETPLVGPPSELHLTAIARQLEVDLVPLILGCQDKTAFRNTIDAAIRRAARREPGPTPVTCESCKSTNTRRYENAGGLKMYSCFDCGWHHEIIGALASTEAAPIVGTGPGDRAMAGARLDEARRWAHNWHGENIGLSGKALETHQEQCRDCLRISELERVAAIERSQTPQAREAVVDSPREARTDGK